MTQRRWRGFVRLLAEDVLFRGRPDDQEIELLAEQIVVQWRFTRPVETYYQAAADALASGERIAPERGDDDVWRDFLTRLIRALDARRPWPEPPFRQLEAVAWPEHVDAPRVANLALSRMQVQERLNRLFDKSISPPTLLIHLRTGEKVALRASGRYTEPGVTVHSTDAARATVEALTSLTGIRPDELT